MTLGIKQQIAWLQIPMNQLTRMHILKRFQKLINNVFLMNFLQYARPYDYMQISFHKVKHQIKVFIIFGFYYVQQSNYVIVPIQLLQEHNFTEGSLCVSRVMEGVEYFFEGHDSFQLSIDGFPHNTIGAFAQLLYDFVFLENVRLYLFCHCFRKYL